MKTSHGENYIHLELARGIAAIVVVLSHLSAFILVDFPLVQNPSVLTKAVYFICGLGHEAVMVFFVLSGFLITRSIANTKNWRWGGVYA